MFKDEWCFQDAKDTVADELPYGWELAEINNQTYYIDHNTQTTSWLHPRLVLEQKREEYERKQAHVQDKAKVSIFIQILLCFRIITYLDDFFFDFI